MAWADRDIRYPMDAVPALPVCAGTVAGVFGGVWLVDRGNVYVLWIVASLAALAVFLWILKRHRLAVVIGFTALGVVLASVRMPLSLAAEIRDAQGTVTGTVERAGASDDATRLIVRDAVFLSRDGKLKADITRGNIEARVYDCDRMFRPGDRVCFSGRLHDIGRSNRPDIPYSDDFAAMARVHGVVGYVSLHADSLHSLGYAPTLMQSIAAEGSSAMRDAIVRAGFDEDAAAFVMAVLAGDETFMDPELTSAFRVAGVAHVLALSGLHVGIIAALFAAALWMLRLLPGGRLIYAATLALAVLTYGFCAGMPPSVARASVMLAVLLYSRWLEWPCPTLNALFVTVTIWLYINPMWLWSPGFQLSCAALLGVVWFSRLCRAEDTRPSVSFIVSVIVVPAGALVATSLLTVVYFHALPVWFLPANIVTAFFVPVIITASVLSVVCVMFGLSPGFLPRLVDFAYSAFTNTLDFFAGLPKAQIADIYPDTLQTVIFVVAVILIFILAWRRSFAVLTAAALTVSALVVSAFAAPDVPEVEVYVTSSPAETEIVTGAGGNFYAVTENGDVAAVNRLCRHLKGKRRCDTIAPMPSRAVIGPVSRRGDLLTFDGSNLLMLNTADSVIVPRGVHLDYVLVSGHWRGDIVAAAAALQADTFLLPNSLNHRLRSRWLDELNETGQPVCDISLSGWRYVRKKY